MDNNKKINVFYNQNIVNFNRNMRIYTFAHIHANSVVIYCYDDNTNIIKKFRRIKYMTKRDIYFLF